MTDNKSIQNMNFEQAMSALEKIVHKIDTAEGSLAESIDNFETGMLLKQHCEKLLTAAKLKIDKICKNESGEISLTDASELSNN